MAESEFNRRSITAALGDPKVQDALAAQGVDKRTGSSEETRTYLAGELKKWEAIVKQSPTR